MWSIVFLGLAVGAAVLTFGVASVSSLWLDALFLLAVVAFISTIVYAIVQRARKHVESEHPTLSSPQREDPRHQARSDAHATPEESHTDSRRQ